MAGTAVLSTIKHDVSGAATTFRDGAGNEIGRFCRQSASFVGSTASINGSFNSSSVTRSGTGQYTIAFSISLADNGYSFAGVSSTQAAYNTFVVGPSSTGATKTTAAFSCVAYNYSAGVVDPYDMQTNIFR